MHTASPASWLRRSVGGLALAGLGAVLAAGGAILLAMQDVALVDPGRALTPTDVARVRQLVQAADPRLYPGAGVRRVDLSEQDVQLLLDDASRRLLQGAARARFTPGAAELEFSARVDQLARRTPALTLLLPLGAWLNVSTQWREDPAGLPRLARVHVGRLPLPAGALAWAVERIAARQGAAAEVALARSLVERVSFTPARVSLAYRWGEDVRHRVRETLVPPAEQDRLRAYHERLVAVAAGLPRGGPDRPVALSTLVMPLFELAQRRSAALAPVRPDGQAGVAADSSAVARQENKAALLTLVLYAAGQSPAKLIAGAADWPQPARRVVQLGGRDDFALHFLISAFIAAEGGGRLADAVGVYKEISDSRDGSGFSFNDLAADRSGTRFGQRAAHDGAQLQQQARAGLHDTDLLPDVRDLPEFLPEAEFRRQYGRIGSPAYARQIDKIETRLRAMPLLR